MAEKRKKDRLRIGQKSTSWIRGTSLNRQFEDIQSWLDHSDITTALNVYGHVLGGDMKSGTFAGHKTKTA